MLLRELRPIEGRGENPVEEGRKRLAEAARKGKVEEVQCIVYAAVDLDSEGARTLMT